MVITSNILSSSRIGLGISFSLESEKIVNKPLGSRTFLGPPLLLLLVTEFVFVFLVPSCEIDPLEREEWGVCEEEGIQIG